MFWNTITIVRYEHNESLIQVDKTPLNLYEVKYIPSYSWTDQKAKYVTDNLTDAMEIFHDLLFKETYGN